MTKFLDTPPTNAQKSTAFNAALKNNLGKWAEYHSYKKRNVANATAYHIRKHINAWTEPQVEYAAVTRRKSDGTFAVWVSAISITEADDGNIE